MHEPAEWYTMNACMLANVVISKAIVTPRRVNFDDRCISCVIKVGFCVFILLHRHRLAIVMAHRQYYYYYYYYYFYYYYYSLYEDRINKTAIQQEMLKV